MLIMVGISLSRREGVSSAVFFPAGEGGVREKREAQRTMKLHQLKIGEKAKIASIVQEKSAYCKQLAAMGVTKGAEVILLHLAPLADPMVIQVNNTRLSLRKKESERIEVYTHYTSRCELSS